MLYVECGYKKTGMETGMEKVFPNWVGNKVCRLKQVYLFIAKHRRKSIPV